MSPAAHETTESAPASVAGTNPLLSIWTTLGKTSSASLAMAALSSSNPL